MFYRESPNVKNIERKYFFPEIYWLDSKYFQEIEIKNEIKPYIRGIDDEKMYIGKTIPENNSDYSNPMSMYEIIGSVVKNADGRYCLKVPWGSTVHTLNENFVVLSIQDENSYHWIKESNGAIPKFALRGSLDVYVNEFLYIGRTILNSSEIKGIYYHDFSMIDFNESITPSIGKIHPSHSCLYIPIGTSEVLVKEYEALCLKPTPASLKILARSVIRTKLDHGVSNIKEIFQNTLPQSLIKYLEYPKRLCYGEYMLKDEKLLSECGDFELSIDKENNLICKDIKKQNIEISRTYNVESFYLHHNKIVMCHCDGTSFEVFAQIGFNIKPIPNEYCFKFFTETDKDNKNKKELKYFLIEIFDNDGNIIHSEKIYRSVPINIDERYEALYRELEYLRQTHNSNFNIIPISTTFNDQENDEDEDEDQNN